MKLVSFLGWEYDDGIYRSEIDGEFYRVVDNKLEIYDPYLLKWEECSMPINEHYKLKSVEKVGRWSEGFEIHSEEEWDVVVSCYLQRDFNVLDSTKLRAENFIKNNVVFYAFPYYGILEATIHEHIVKRDLILKPIKYPPKFYAKYTGKADFGEEMYWQIGSNYSTVSLVRRDNVENWYSVGILSTLKGWKRCGVTKENAVFIPAGSDKI